MKVTPQDRTFMARALRLAKRGAGRTHPNPMVGAVVVKDGHVIGEGWHKGPGEPHAEALAVREAGPRARGGTLYVTLEPCDHHGRTPPCTRAIIDAGISRVVAACGDPHPLVNGKGFNRLNGNGVVVLSGMMKERAEELNRAFLYAAVRDEPYVTLKIAATLDGRIADPAGRSRWITGASARRAVHRLRSEVDAVLVGAGTVIKDDPGLDVRDIRGGRNPLRVILDPYLQTPPESRIVENAADGRTIIVTGRDTGSGKERGFQERGVRLLPLPVKSGYFRWHDLARSMMDEGIMHLMVEGGARTSTWFLMQSAVRRIELFMAPKCLGGEGLASVLELGIKELGDAVRFKFRRCRRVGEDVHIVADAV